VSDEVNLFAQQEANRRRSVWLVIGFVLFFAWVGFGGDIAFFLMTSDAPSSSYRHVIPFIGIVSTLAAGGILAPWLGEGAVGDWCLGAGRARVAGAETAGECCGGNGDRFGAAQAQDLGGAGRRS
jgi:hypothetical protein